MRSLKIKLKLVPLLIGIILSQGCSQTSSNESSATNEADAAAFFAGMTAEQKKLENLGMLSLSTKEDIALSFDFLERVKLDSKTFAKHLEIELIDKPKFGKIELAGGGKFTYKPNADFAGKDSISLKITSEKYAVSRIIRGDILVDAVNDKPAMNDMTIRLEPGSAVNINLAAIDPDAGETLRYAISENISSSTVTLLDEEAGLVRIQNSDGTNLSDSFQVTVTDMAGESTSARVTVLLGRANVAPVAFSDRYESLEDEQVSGVLKGLDEILATPRFKITKSPEHGLIVRFDAKTGTFSYLPNQDYFGLDEFSFVTNDNVVDSVPATIKLSIGSANDQPRINIASRFVVNEDQIAQVEIKPLDPEGDTIYFQTSVQPLIGSIADEAPTIKPDGTYVFKYQPKANYFGPDVFGLKFNDYKGGAAAETIEIPVWVNSVQDAPLPVAQTINVDEEETIRGTLLASDGDGDALTFSILRQPRTGNIQLLEGNAFELTLKKDATGDDSFEYRVSDTTGLSTNATVVVNVNNINDAPVTREISINTIEDTPHSINLNASTSDPDNNAFSFSVVSAPQNGTVTLDARNSSAVLLTYTPNKDYFGSDIITFKANDGQVDSNVSTITVYVSPVDDAPTLGDPDIVPVFVEDITTGVFFKINDVDSKNFFSDVWYQQRQFSCVYSGLKDTSQQPTCYAYSTATNSNQLLFHFFFPTNFNGDFTVRLTVTVRDTLNQNKVFTLNKTFSGTVLPVNDPPYIRFGDYSGVAETDQLRMPVSDPDGDTLTYTITSVTPRGSVSFVDAKNGLFTLSGVNNVGLVAISYRAKDPSNAEVTGTFRVRFSSDTLPVVPSGLSFDAVEDRGGYLLIKNVDPNTDLLTCSASDSSESYYYSCYSQASTTSNGTDISVYYHPRSNFFGRETLTIKVYEYYTSTLATGTIQVNVAAVPDAPVMRSSTFTLDSYVGSGAVIASDIASDADGDTLSYTFRSLPTKGVVSFTGNNLRYTPDANATVGQDTFEVVATDPSGSSASARFYVNVRR